MDTIEPQDSFWLSKLQHFTLTMAFCLTISALQYAVTNSEQSYAVPVVYSVLIGTVSWVIIDFGRHLFPANETNEWPAGVAGVALAAGGIAGGYLVGTWLGDRWFGWSSWSGAGLLTLPTSILVAVLSGALGTYYFYAAGKTQALERHLRAERLQAAEARLKLLEAQLEPHMLFNTLANLRVLVASDPARAQAMLDHLIAYLRATLSASRATLHPLADEMDRLRDYLELMAVRMGPRLAYTLDLPDALRDVPVPPLLLQPLVENAIRHGLEPQVEGGHIAVRATTQDSPHGPLLVIEVQDTGAGLPATLPTPGPGQSFGLAQVRERLATLHGSAGALELIAVQPSGTSATVTFPLKSADTP